MIRVRPALAVLAVVLAIGAGLLVAGLTQLSAAVDANCRRLHRLEQAGEQVITGEGMRSDPRTLRALRSWRRGDCVPPP